MNTPNGVRRWLFLAAEQAAQDVAKRAALAAQHAAEDAAKGLVGGATAQDAAQNFTQGATGGCLPLLRRRAAGELFSYVGQHDWEHHRQQPLKQVAVART